MLYGSQPDLMREDMSSNPCAMGGFSEGTSMQAPSCQMPGGSPPIVHPTQVRCVTRQIMHEVPHVCPVHTQIINQHVCRHTYRPSYTCGEQNQVCHVHEGSCNQF